MKYIIYFILIFIAGLLFLPETGTAEIRNPELFITVIVLIAICFVIKFIKLTIASGRIKKTLKENKITTRSIRFGIGKTYITAETHTEALEICLLMRKKSYYKYHFVDKGHIEFYKTTITAVKNGRDRVTVSQALPEVSHVGDQRIKWSEQDNCKRYLVLDKFPNRVTSAESNKSLGNGDRIAPSEVILYDLKGFLEYINQ